MATAIESAVSELTVADLVERLGPMPLSRIRFQPPPGTATEDDVVALHDQQSRLFELVDGILVEKTVGAYESYLAVLIARWLGNFVEQHQLGEVLGADGTIRLAPGLVRIPDVAFFPKDRFRADAFPAEPIPLLIPLLAVEVLSKSNTKREMQRKLDDYFYAGTSEVWFVEPSLRQLHVYESATLITSTVKAPEKMSGRAILPGFELDLGKLFAKQLGN